MRRMRPSALTYFIQVARTPTAERIDLSQFLPVIAKAINAFFPLRPAGVPGPTPRLFARRLAFGYRISGFGWNVTETGGRPTFPRVVLRAYGIHPCSHKQTCGPGVEAVQQRRNTSCVASPKACASKGHYPDKCFCICQRVVRRGLRLVH